MGNLELGDGPHARAALGHPARKGAGWRCAPAPARISGDIREDWGRGVEAQPPGTGPTPKPRLPASPGPSGVSPGTLLAPPTPCRAPKGSSLLPRRDPGPADSRGADAGPRPRRAARAWRPIARHSRTPGSRAGGERRAESALRRAGGAGAGRGRSRRSFGRGAELSFRRAGGARGAESTLQWAGRGRSRRSCGRGELGGRAGVAVGLPAGWGWARRLVGVRVLAGGAGDARAAGESEFPQPGGAGAPPPGLRALAQGGVAGPLDAGRWTSRGSRATLRERVWAGAAPLREGSRGFCPVRWERFRPWGRLRAARRQGPCPWHVAPSAPGCLWSSAPGLASGLSRELSRGLGREVGGGQWWRATGIPGDGPSLLVLDPFFLWAQGRFLCGCAPLGQDTPPGCSQAPSSLCSRVGRVGGVRSQSQPDLTSRPEPRGPLEQSLMAKPFMGPLSR